ncbi:hypothetical protein AAMO2058_000006900 [Amorphochlora amoebiformis]
MEALKLIDGSERKYRSLDAKQEDEKDGHGHNHSHQDNHGHHGHGERHSQPEHHNGKANEQTKDSIDIAREREKKLLLIASGLCILFMVAEIVGGILCGSIAILTDAAHLLSDLAGNLISICSIYISQSGVTENMTYGFHRAEILGALLSVMLVWVMTGILVYEAVKRMIYPTDVNGKMMFIIATMGLVVNVIMFYILGGIGGDHGHGHSHGTGGHDVVQLKRDHGHSHADHDDNQRHGHTHGSHNAKRPNGGRGHSHGDHEDSDHEDSDHEDSDHDDGDHGHSHSDGYHEAKKDGKLIEDIERAHSHSDTPEGHGHDGSERVGMNVKSALIHVLGDAIQSVGVMIGAAIIWLRPSWRIVDPICTFVFALIVLLTTFDVVRQQVHILMEGSPANTQEIKRRLLEIAGVRSVHCFHCWTLTSGKIALTAHLLTDIKKRPEILKSAKKLCQDYGINHTTFQVECITAHKDLCIDGEDCM